MKFVTFNHNGADRVGIIHQTLGVLDASEASRVLLDAENVWPDMLSLIEQETHGLTLAGQILEAALSKPDRNGLWTPLDQVRLRAPVVRPRKNVFCVGRNYKKHIVEAAQARGAKPVFPEIPEFFSKPPTTVVGHEDNIVLDPKSTSQLDYEVELAVVIGKKLYGVDVDDALDYVFGYSIVNDISARDAQKAHGQWFKGKSFDTFCPIGPCVTTQDEFGSPAGHRISLQVNGEIRQDANTDDMLFSVAQIIASLSASMTLEPGDIIATGTPSGVALGMTPQKWLKDGDLIEAEIEGIGILKNRVVEAQ